MDAQDITQRLTVARQVDAADPPRDWIVAVDLGPEHPLLRLVIEPAARETCEAEAEVFRAAGVGWISDRYDGWDEDHRLLAQTQRRSLAHIQL